MPFQVDKTNYSAYFDDFPPQRQQDYEYKIEVHVLYVWLNLHIYRLVCSAYNLATHTLHAS